MMIFKPFFYLFILFATLVQAKEYKAVFDCNSGDGGYLVSRMFLIERTIDMIQKDGNSVVFALTVHGSCAPIVSKNIDEVIFDDDKLALFEKARKQLTHLIEVKNVEVIVCAMSLNAKNIPKEDVLKNIKISKNSYIDTIAYQNDGYALMVFE